MPEFLIHTKTPDGHFDGVYARSVAATHEEALIDAYERYKDQFDRRPDQVYLVRPKQYQSYQSYELEFLGGKLLRVQQPARVQVVPA